MSHATPWLVGALVLALSPVASAQGKDRGKAKGLYIEARTLLEANDHDGALAKRLEGHKYFANGKVVKAIVEEYERRDDIRAAAKFLDSILVTQDPADVVTWANSRRSSYEARLTEIAEKEEEARRKKEAAERMRRLEAEEQKKKDDEARKKKEAEEQILREAEEERLAAETFERQQAEEARTAAQARRTARKRGKTSLTAKLAWGTGALAVAGLAAGVFFGLEAGTAQDEAETCRKNLTALGGSCTEADRQQHVDEQMSATGIATWSAVGAGVAAAGATALFYMKSIENPANARHPWLSVSPAGIALGGGF